MAANILGGGGLGGGGPADPLMAMYLATGPVGAVAVGGGGGRRQRPPRVVAPPPNEYRVEVSSPQSTARCCACSAAIGGLATRVGVRPQGGGHWRWHHLDCLPAQQWQEARARPGGVQGLRGIPPREQARVRAHLRLQ